jgi:hypothetical protein
MSWNGFGNLDLSGVTPDDFAPLAVGEHEVRCTDVEILTGDNGKNKRIVATLNATNGGGTIKAGFNVVHTGSAQAQEIGLKQLKSFLVAGGHPNPDRPGDIASLKGLTCRVFVGMGKPFLKNGEQKQYPEVKRFIIEGEGGSAPSPAPSTKKIDDEIPF